MWLRRSHIAATNIMECMSMFLPMHAGPSIPGYPQASHLRRQASCIRIRWRSHLPRRSCTISELRTRS